MTDPDSPEPSTRLDQYEKRTAPALLVLAFVFIAVYATPILKTDLDPSVRRAIETAGWVIWSLFAADLVIRVALAEHRWRYLVTHPVDILAVLLPALRPLRVLRVFTAGQVLISRAGRFSFFHATQAITLVATLLVVIGALAVLDAERAAPEQANITDFPDALWWATTTVTTVGYGDRFPVTGTGRTVAAALMIVGISLVGAITAAVAGWFLAQTQRAVETEERELEERLDRLEQRLDRGLKEIRDAVSKTHH